MEKKWSEEEEDVWRLNWITVCKAVTALK